MRSLKYLRILLTIVALGILQAVQAEEPKSVSQPVAVTILHVFHEGGTVGYDAGQVAVAGSGVIYGTIPGGGPNAAGLVYRVSPDGSARILHTFSGPDGIYPSAAPIEGSDGAIYGAVQFGSTFSEHCGIYRVTNSGSFAVVYLLPNPIAGETFVARIKAPSAEQVYTIDGGSLCNKFTEIARPASISGPVFSVSEGKTPQCCGPQQAAREWNAMAERFGESVTQLVDPGHDVHRNSCSPEQPTLAASGERFGAVTCQIAGHIRCFIYRLDKHDTVSITYRFNEPLPYCRFPGPLVAADDGNLYSAIVGYSSPYLAVFRLDVGSARLTSRHE